MRPWYYRECYSMYTNHCGCEPEKAQLENLSQSLFSLVISFSSYSLSVFLTNSEISLLCSAVSTALITLCLCLSNLTSLSSLIYFPNYELFELYISTLPVFNRTSLSSSVSTTNWLAILSDKPTTKVGSGKMTIHKLFQALPERVSIKWV